MNLFRAARSITANHAAPPRPFRALVLRGWRRSSALAGLFGFLFVALATAQESVAEPAEDAPAAETTEVESRLIRLRLPITGNADAHFKNVIQRAVGQMKASGPAAADRRPVLVVEFDPQRAGNGFGQGSDFERALSVARFLTSDELNGIKTVAYIPRTIKGHAVLVAMACEEIVMAPDAEIGEAGVDEDPTRPVEPGVVRWYEQIAEGKRTIPEAIAIGMLGEAEVLQVETEDGTHFVLGDELEELARNHTVVEEKTLVPPGSLGLFSGREGRELRFVKHFADDRDSLARVLQVSPASLIEDQSLVADWRPIMIDIKGPLTASVVKRVETMIGSELERSQVNWIGLRIDSPGGRWSDCLRLADTLATLDREKVRTVAYVPVEASGGAALVALACEQLVMQPGAHVGGMPAAPGDPNDLPEVDTEFESAKVSIRESLAAKTNHSWSLLIGMVDPTIEVFRYTHRQTGETKFFSPAEANEQPDANDWRQDEAITKAGAPLKLSAEDAKGLGIASQVVDNFDEFRQLYGFGEGEPREVRPNWALELVEALASPGLAVALLVIGIIGIYIELHTPGLGVGGFVATVAFLLFFWSKFLHGTVEWLEILLFLGGVFFLLLELLVLPGFGIFGLGGAAMILAAIVLAGTTSWLPRTDNELAELRGSLTVVVGGLLAALAAAMALRRYLPHAPILRDIMLAPPAGEELIEREHREALADFTGLVGHEGTAATHLMPAGKATIDGRLIDVIADGDVIDRGTPVEVVSARGTRVMVRAIRNA
ncbi:MAG: NfeD family protein [Pirellulales bacterium]